MELRINRIPDDLHRLAKLVAAHKSISLNKFVIDAMTAAVLRAALNPELKPLIEKEIKKIDQAQRSAG